MAQSKYVKNIKMELINQFYYIFERKRSMYNFDAGKQFIKYNFYQVNTTKLI